MQEYELPIVVTNQGPATPALLKIIRLPTSWYAAISESADRYASFSQEKTDLNGGFSYMNAREFLDRVQLVAAFTHGISFEWGEDR